jgi:LysM repeat protein
MTRKQMGFIVGINAAISTVITVVLVLVILPALKATTPEAPAVPTGSSLVAEVTETASQITSTPSQVIHIVQGGDTISGLALKYDVPAEDIIAANNLINPNFLQVGAELIIPVGGLAEATSTFTPEPTPTETPLPFNPPSVETATAIAESSATAAPTASLPMTGNLQIEITELLGAGDLSQERVIIMNKGERLADMQGWTLSDDGGNTYTFSNFRLWGNGSSVTVHSRIGQDGSPSANFYWGKLTAIWTPGERATLRDANGAVVATYTVAQ